MSVPVCGGLTRPHAGIPARRSCRPRLKAATSRQPRGKPVRSSGTNVDVLRQGVSAGGLRLLLIRDSISASEKENSKMQNKSYAFLTAIVAAVGLVILSLR